MSAPVHPGDDWASRAYQSADSGDLLREDVADAPIEPPEPIDCGPRLHLCGAVCCRLPFPLSAAEVDHGPVTWDTDRPYWIKRNDGGMCVHNDAATLACTVHAERPRPCRAYSCRDDPRIWRDFDGMVINSAVVEVLRSRPIDVFVTLTAKPPQS